MGTIAKLIAMIILMFAASFILFMALFMHTAVVVAATCCAGTAALFSLISGDSFFSIWDQFFPAHSEFAVIGTFALGFLHSTLSVCYFSIAALVWQPWSDGKRRILGLALCLTVAFFAYHFLAKTQCNLQGKLLCVAGSTIVLIEFVRGLITDCRLLPQTETG